MDRSYKKKQYERQRRDRIAEAYKDLRDLLARLSFDPSKLNTNLHVLSACARALRRQLGQEPDPESESESESVEEDLRAVALRGGATLLLNEPVVRLGFRVRVRVRVGLGFGQRLLVCPQGPTRSKTSFECVFPNLGYPCALT